MKTIRLAAALLGITLSLGVRSRGDENGPRPEKADQPEKTALPGKPHGPEPPPQKPPEIPTPESLRAKARWKLLMEGETSPAFPAIWYAEELESHEGIDAALTELRAHPYCQHQDVIRQASGTRTLAEYDALLGVDQCSRCC